jgi:hypothetical protein
LPHAARAPQQRVVGGKAFGEAGGVIEQHVAHAVDALEQGKRHAIDVGDRQKDLGLGLPDEGVAPIEVGLAWRQRGETLKRAGDPLDQAPNRFLEVHGPLV